MSLPGDHLAARVRAQGWPVYAAAGVMWWLPEPGVLEPLARHIALDDETRNVEILLELAGAREARFGTATAGQSPLPLRVWRPSVSRVPEPRDEVAPLSAWQVPDPLYAGLVAAHDAWSAVGWFEDRALRAYLVTCLDDGWLHEVACSDEAFGDELRRYCQRRIGRSGDCEGMIGGPERLGFTNANLRWSSLRRRRFGWRWR